MAWCWTSEKALPEPLYPHQASMMDHSVNAPSQWEGTLHCNVISHCLVTYTKWFQQWDNQFSFFVASLLSSDIIWWHRSVTTLAQVMVCCLMSPSSYLNQYWHLPNEALWHSAESDFTMSSQAITLCKDSKLHLLGTNELIHGGFHFFQANISLNSLRPSDKYMRR